MLRRCARRGFATDLSALKRTALYDAHLSQGGKMVDFCGYALPLQYEDSPMASHVHVREAAGAFDVSHMGQLLIRGERRLDWLERLVPSDLGKPLKVNQGRLSVLTNEGGGILDDTVITKKEDHVYMVVNAGCKEKDIAHMTAHLAAFNEQEGADVTLEVVGDRSLIALQGPLAAAVLARHVPADHDFAAQRFMFTAELPVDGVPCWVTRCGYTGEDGFEVSVPSARATDVWMSLCGDEEVRPVGLAVRNSLRLEAGLCLYGNDLDESTTPVEAGLAWVIGKRRRREANFLGAEPVLQQLAEGAPRARVGLTVLDGAPAFEETPILEGPGGRQVGTVTSGTFSPSLKAKISMGYVEAPFAAPGTEVTVKVHGKEARAVVTDMPFVPSNYYMPKTKKKKKKKTAAAAAK